jgi:hypothetical protein
MEPDFLEEPDAFEDLYETWVDYTTERATGGTAEEERRSFRAAARRFVTRGGGIGPMVADHRAGKENGC